MKQFFIIFICIYLYGFDVYYPIKTNNLNKDTTFYNIIYTFDHLKKLKESKRRKFEKLSIYESRLKKYQKNFSNFIQTTYSINLPPDKVKLDYENLILYLYINFPLNVEEERFNSPKKYIKIPISGSEDKIRVLYTFYKNINVHLIFKITTNKNVLILKKGAFYEDKKIY